MFGRRPDGTRVDDLSPLRRFMPFISPRRNDSLVYLSQDLDVEELLAFVERWNESRKADPPLTLFHLILRGVVRVLDARPRLNRFTAGGRVWQRDGIWISFSAKKKMDDHSPVFTVKRRFDPQESLDAMVARLHGELQSGRGGARTNADREVDLLLRTPPVITRFLVGCAKAADWFGWVPGKMIEGDPMFASVFVANLGSVGLEAGFHHLWEYGTIPIFCVVGRIKPGPDGRRIATLKWTFDERVEDGLYAARSLEIFRELMSKPEEL